MSGYARPFRQHPAATDHMPITQGLLYPDQFERQLEGSSWAAQGQLCQAAGSCATATPSSLKPSRRTTRAK
jgi:hypothetical protein